MAFNFYYVYMLQCNDGSFYTGHTDNLEFRLKQHKTKKVDGYTASRLPVKLVYYDTFPSRDEAFKAERKIKGWSRAKKEALINKNWKKIIELSNLKSDK